MRADGADRSRAMARGLQDRVQEMHHRRLAVRPGDADHREGSRRLIEHHAGHRAHRLADGPNADLRHVEVEPPLHDERDRPRAHRIASVAVSVDVRARDAEEERAGGDLAGIEGDLADLDACVAADLGTTHGVGHRGQRHLGKGFTVVQRTGGARLNPPSGPAGPGIDGSGVRRERRQAHGRCGRDREPLDHVSSDLGEDRGGRHAPVDRPRLVDRYRDHHSGIRRGEEPHE